MQHHWSLTYPRPQLRRASFFPLNGDWTLNGQSITLPWPPQAPLSNYHGEIEDELYYETAFTLPSGLLPPNHRLVLHFGAVDQVAHVSLNGVPIVHHEGGYLPFSADITSVWHEGENRLTVHATDTLSHNYPYGKQSKRPHGMWYTPVSGIWQTVWLEAVPEHGAVAALKIIPDLTGVTLEVQTDSPEYTVTVPLENGALLTAQGRERQIRLDLPNPHLWSTEDPYLYEFAVTTRTDRVESYFALRTVSVREMGGFSRLCLNGAPVFLHGVLDQGYFHDGIFLPREPQEYERDILRMKQLGYNTLRKHIKLEPEQFYYACDRLGMLVIQDMVNSGEYRYLSDTVVPTFVSKKRRDTRRRKNPVREAFFEKHVMDSLDRLYNHPCIVGYTIFNEGWGQYDSDRIYRACKQRDPSRFFVSTSGWFAQRESDVHSEHIYFRNEVLHATRPGQFLLLSECGGFTRPIPGHGSDGKKNYGYGREASEQALTERILGLYRQMVLPSIPNGLCGCIYTQLSDIEGEVNGLYTYDRQICKVIGDELFPMSAQLQQALYDCLAHNGAEKGIEM